MRRRCAILLSVIACGCDSDPTGIVLDVDYDPALELDQLAIQGSFEDGSEAFPAAFAPSSPTALTGGEDTIVFLLRDELAGRTIEMRVEGLSGGNVVARGDGSVRLTVRSMVELEIDLLRISRSIEDGGIVPEEDAGGAAADATSDGTDAGPAEDAHIIDGAPDASCSELIEIVGDGIDQDCDEADSCHRDLDGDGFGSNVVVGDDDLDCANGSSPTAVLGSDCDDADPLVYPGTLCDDGSSSSYNDVCFGPVCRGYETSGCASSCDTCSTGDCCVRECRGADCPDCPSGCSCDMRCDDHHRCNLTCEPGSVCHLSVRDIDDATLRCSDGASCDLECDDATCTLDCLGGALCIVSSCIDSDCMLHCAGGAMSCPDGSQACNRDCPP